MSEKNKSFLIRLPQTLHDWLKANVKEGTINDFILQAINEKVSAFKPKMTEEDINFEINPLFQELLTMRNQWVNDIGFLYVEDRVLEEGLNSEEVMRLLRDVPDYRKDSMWNNYFAKVVKLDDNSRREFSQLVDDADFRKRYGGDPNAVVFKHLTAKEIVKAFNPQTSYSTRDVAAKLGLTYMEAYVNIVPWLIGHGFKVVSGKSPK